MQKWIKRGGLLFAGALMASVCWIALFLWYESNAYYMVQIFPDSRYPLVMEQTSLENCLRLAAAGHPPGPPDICVPADMKRREELVFAERAGRISAMHSD